jgi:hypothetical protein
MRHARFVDLLLVAGALVLITALNLPSVLAQSQQEGPGRKFRSGGTVTVATDETLPHDLYVTGGTIAVRGRIEGDLVVAGGTVDVSGPVGGDIAAAGGTVTIAGPVDGDVRVAGGTVTVSGPVTRDLVAGAGTLNISAPARIGGDLIFGAGETNLAGTVAGGVLGSTGTYTKTGSIGGTERVELSQQRERREASLLSRLLDQVRRYLSIILFGGLLLWLAPRLFHRAASQLQERPLPSFGIGIVAAISVLVILVLLFIAMLVLSIPLGILGFGRLVLTAILAAFLGGGILTFLFLLVILFVANAVVGYVIGRLLLSRTGDASLDRAAWALLLGVLIVVVLTALPVVGGILNVISVLFGLGAIVIAVWRWRAPQPDIGRAA